MRASAASSPTCSTTPSPSRPTTAPSRSAARRVGPEIEIVVDDEGPGIPEDKLEDIFNRFYSDRPQTDRTVGKNSGLGLSISREIVNAYGGRIWAENRMLSPGAEAGVAGRSDRAQGPARARCCRRPLHRPAACRRCRTIQGSAARLDDAPELVHGTCVALGRTAALLRGPSGSGKSDLALRFLFLARRGPAAVEAPILVADDQVELVRAGDRLLARPPDDHPRQDGGARHRHRRGQAPGAGRAGAGRRPGARRRTSSACPTTTRRPGCWASECRWCGCAPGRPRRRSSWRWPWRARNTADVLVYAWSVADNRLFPLASRGPAQSSCARLGQALPQRWDTCVDGDVPGEGCTPHDDRRRHCRSWRPCRGVPRRARARGRAAGAAGGSAHRPR